MKFRYAVLLAALAIAPVCAKRIRVSDECRVIDSTLSVDSAGFDRGGLCSSGNRPLSFRRTSKGGGVDNDNDEDDARKRRRRCSPQTSDDAGCRRRFAGGDDDDEDDARPSRLMTRAAETMIFADPRRPT